MRRWILMLLVCPAFSFLSIQAQKSISKCHYWFDQSKYGETTVAYGTANTLQLSLNTNDLPMGIHHLYMRFQDSDGAWSPLQGWLFFVRELPKNAEQRITSIEYWIDNDYEGRTSMAAQDGQMSFVADASKVRDGLHTLNYRLLDNEGMYSSPQTWLFMKAALSDNTRTVSAGEYWIDGSYSNRKIIGVVDGQVSFKLNADSLCEGLHTLSYRMKDSHGLYTPLQTWMFLRNELRDTTLVNGVKHIEYWFDDDMTTLHSVNAENNTIQFAADASHLWEGLHKLSCRAKDAVGKYSTPEVWAFYKRGNQQKATKISCYRYWWNNHIDKAVTDFVKNDSTAFVFEKQLVVPDYAKTDGFSAESTAKFNILFVDDLGNVSPLQAFDVPYPDEQPPMSTIEADKGETAVSVVLTWKTNESAIEDYNIYYSEDEQPFVLWLPNTTRQTATFKGQAGRSYRFTVTARDKAGNRETLDESKCVKVTFTTKND